MLAVKGNREVKIDAHEQKDFEKNGYKVYSRETHELLTVDAGGNTASLLERIKELEEENAQLKLQTGAKLSKDDLKAIATERGIEFNSRTTVAELEELIAAHSDEEDLGEK